MALGEQWHEKYLTALHPVDENNIVFVAMAFS